MGERLAAKDLQKSINRLTDILGLSSSSGQQNMTGPRTAFTPRLSRPRVWFARSLAVLVAEGIFD